MTIASAEKVPGWEIDAFRLVNSFPQALYPLVWPLMQFGTFIAIPALTVVALGFRRWRLAGVMAAGGIGVYYLAKVVKEIVYRLRPGALLTQVHLRGIGAPGLGFPSGHAAVSAALAVAASAYVNRGLHWVSIALAVIVSFARVYVGGHLPIDVIGGAALGVAVSSALHLVLGVPAPKDTSRDRKTKSEP